MKRTFDLQLFTATAETIDFNANESFEAARIVAMHQRGKFREKAQGWIARSARKFKAKYGYDPVKECFEKQGFTLSAVARQLRESKLREDVTTDQLYALTTGMVTFNLANAYQNVPTVYRDIANIKTSTKAEEGYFAMQRGDVPTPLEDNEPAPSSSLGGALTRIRNYRWARIIEVSTSLEADDQTGQISDESIGLGQKMAYAEELWWLTQLVNAYVSGNIRPTSGSGTGIIPPMNIAGQAPSGYGGPACTAGPVTRDAIQNLWTAADFITDIEGDLSLVDPNVGLFSNGDKVIVKTILGSSYNPNTVSGSANVTPGTFAENPLKDIVVQRFTRFAKYFTGSALNGGNIWFLGESGKFGSFQDRTALSVTKENPNAGKSWEANLDRTKAERRFGAGVTLPDFVLRGN